MLTRGPAPAAVALALVAGCNTSAPTGVPGNDVVPANTAEAPGLGPSPMPGATIRMWVTPPFNPESSEGSGLAAALADFEQDSDGWRVDVQVKAEAGPTGVRAFLESTHRVIPDRVPDIAVLSLADMSWAMDAGLLHPIGPGVPAERVAGAYEFARRASANDTAAFAVPFAVNVVAAVARDGPPPADWAGALAGGAFVLPEGRGDLAGTAAALGMFASAGGDPSFPPADTPSAAAALSGFLTDAAQDGLLVRSDEPILSPRGAWNTFLLHDEASWAAVSGGVLLRQQGNFPGFGWGPVPGPGGPAQAIAWGWAMVVPVADDSRAARAETLITWLTEPERRGWMMTAGLLPAWPMGEHRAGLLAELPTPPDPALTTFLEDELARGRTITPTGDWAAAWAAEMADALGAPSNP